jgi:hypothetical protein
MGLSYTLKNGFIQAIRKQNTPQPRCLVMGKPTSARVKAVKSILVDPVHGQEQMFNGYHIFLRAAATALSTWTSTLSPPLSFST